MAHLLEYFNDNRDAIVGLHCHKPDRSKLCDSFDICLRARTDRVNPFLATVNDHYAGMAAKLNAVLDGQRSQGGCGARQ